MTTQPDFSIDFGAFSNTAVTVKAMTNAGKSLLAEMFGNAAVSFEMPKSRAVDFARFAEQKGLSIK